MTIAASTATQEAGAAGMASGAQLAPLAQQLAQQIAAGAAPMPTTTEGWQNLVAQFSAKGEPLNLPTGTLSLAATISPGSKAANATTAPTAQAAQPTNSKAPASGQAAFVEQMTPWAKYASQQTGLNADLILAQWGNETEWGQSPAWQQKFNPAGIGITDASVPGDSYGSVGAGVQAYINFLDANNPNSRYYKVPRSGDANAQAIALGNSGWAAGGYNNGSGPGSDLIASMQSIGTTGASNGVNLPPADNMGSGTAVSYAQTQLGTPYVWGGEQAGVGFDCSGLVQAAFNHAGINLPRTAQEQYNATTKVPAGQQLQSGDLVFFGQDTSNISHVGIYIGGGKMIDAPNSGSVVRTENYQWADYLGATRPGDATGVSALPTTAAPGRSAPTRGAVLGNYLQIFGQVQSALNSMGAPK